MVFTYFYTTFRYKCNWRNLRPGFKLTFKFVGWGSSLVIFTVAILKWVYQTWFFHDERSILRLIREWSPDRIMVEKLLKVYIIFAFTRKLAKNSKIPNYTIDNSVIQNRKSDMKLFYPEIRRKKLSSTTSSCLFISWPTTVVELWWADELIYIQIDRCLHWARTTARPIIFSGMSGRMGIYGRYEIGNIS